MTRSDLSAASKWNSSIEFSTEHYNKSNYVPVIQIAIIFSLFYSDYFKGPRLLIIMIPLWLVIDLAIWFLFHFIEIWLLTLTKSLLRIFLKQLLATALISANQTELQKSQDLQPGSPGIPILELSN